MIPKKKDVRESTKKVRKGDKVLVISGNHSGSTGVVLQFRPGEKVIVQGLNLCKKHVKKSEAHPNGQILSFEKPIHVSNVKVCVDGETAKKLKVRKDEQGDRRFVYNQADGQEVVYRSIKKPK